METFSPLSEKSDEKGTMKKPTNQDWESLGGDFSHDNITSFSLSYHFLTHLPFRGGDEVRK